MVDPDVFKITSALGKTFLPFRKIFFFSISMVCFSFFPQFFRLCADIVICFQCRVELRELSIAGHVDTPC